MRTGKPWRPETIAAIVTAGSHTWDVNEVFSDSTATIQFIELREENGTPNEIGVPGPDLTSSIRSYTIPGPNLVPPTSNKHLLFATPAFAALPGAPTPDYIFPAGSVPFFRTTTGDTISYVAWDSFTYGAGVLPIDGVHSLDQFFNVACNSPTNYAGQAGSVNVNCSLLGDVNDDGRLNITDPTFLLSFQFGGGAAPPSPSSSCGS